MSYQLEVATSGEVDIVDLTPRVNQAVANIAGGLCVVFMKHTTAALTLASLEEGAAGDLQTVLSLLVPQIDWQHLPPEHNTAHVISTLIGASVTIPIHDGKLGVGAFQRLVLIEMQGPQTRSVELHVIETK